MSTDKIIGRIDGAIAHVIFNNPERRNAVSLDMWQAVDALFDRYAIDPAVRVVIVSGAGGKAFVSGADISKFESERATEDGVAHYNATTARAYNKVANFGKPTIAQIDGYCVGGGVGLALCCDMRVCGESSKFSIPAARLGLSYGIEGVRRLMNVVGPSRTIEIFSTARMFDAGEALTMGLVNRVMPDGEVAASVLEDAERITGNAPLTIASIRTTVRETLKDPAERDTELCEALVKTCFDSEDYVEGRRAFMEKRNPAFRGV